MVSEVAYGWETKRDGLSRAQSVLMVLALVVFGTIFIRVVIAPEHGLATPSTLGSLAVAVLLAGFFGLKWRPLSRLASWVDGRSRRRRRAILLGLHLTLTLVSCVVALGVYQPVRGGWDVDVVSQAAVQWATKGTLTDVQTQYFELWTNNIGQLNIMHLIALAVGPSAFAMVALLSGPVLASITIALVYGVAHERADTGTALLAGAASWVLVGMNPYVAVPYTDMYVLLFPVLLMLLMGKAYRSPTLRGRMGWLVAVGVVAGIAAQIKITVLIVVIAAAVIIAVAIALVGRGRRLLVALGAVLMVVSTLATFEAASAVSNGALPAGNDRSQAMPMEYWVATGLSEPYGEWNLDLMDSLAAATSTSGRRQLADVVIEQRLNELGPGGYVAFLYKKLTWVYSDGTYFAFGEAQLAPGAAFAYSNVVAHDIRTFLVPTGGWQNAMYSTLIQGVWLIVLAGVLLAFLRKLRAPFDWFVSTLALTVLGVTAYQAIWEARARYLLMFVPLFILLAFVGARKAVVGVAEDQPAVQNEIPDEAAKDGHDLAKDQVR